VSDRVLVCGGPGSGKTTFARELGRRTLAPLHSLDEVAREGGGRGTETSAGERAAAVARILATPRWIAEGVHLGWTQPLMAGADAIVWLDHVEWHKSSGRIIRRFLRQAITEARGRRGRERFLRFGDYARRLRELIVSVPETRTYPYEELERALAPYARKLTRCRSADDVDAALVTLGGKSAPE
jgi:hypothetical protein